MARTYEEYLEVVSGPDSSAKLMLSSYNWLAGKFRDLRDTLLAGKYEVDPAVFEYLEVLIPTLDEMSKTRDNTGNKDSLPYLTKEEWERDNEILKGMFQLVNCKVGNKTLTQILCDNYNMQQETFEKEIRRISDNNGLFISKDEPALDEPFGVYYSKKRRGGAEWEDARRAYRKMGAEIAALKDELTLSDEQKKEFEDWENCFKTLAGDNEVQNDALKTAFDKLSTPNAFDSFIGKEFDGKSVFKRINEKANNDKKKAELYTAQNYIDSSHGVKSFPRAIKTAYKWISNANIQSNLITTDQATGRKKLNEDALSFILAARQLADAKRNDPENLKNRNLTEAEIKERAAMIRRDSVFEDYIRELNADPAKMELAVTHANAGHGGAFEEDFKEFIQKRPAGMLPNKPMYRRYMPLAKERIETLQAQIKDGGDPAATVAELIVLRGLTQSGRNNDKPIPTDAQNTLQNKTRVLKDYYLFADEAKKKYVKEGIVQSDGSELTTSFRENMLMRLDYDDFQKLTTHRRSEEVKVGRNDLMVMEENTYRAQLDHVRIRTSVLLSKLTDKSKNVADNPISKEEAQAEFKKILKDWLILNHLTRIDMDIESWNDLGILDEAYYQEKMYKNVIKEIDWNKYDELMKDPSKIPGMKMLDEDISEEDMRQCAKDMIEEDPFAAMKKIGKRFKWDLFVPEIHEETLRNKKQKEADDKIAFLKACEESCQKFKETCIDHSVPNSKEHELKNDDPNMQAARFLFDSFGGKYPTPSKLDELRITDPKAYEAGMNVLSFISAYTQSVKQPELEEILNKSNPVTTLKNEQKGLLKKRFDALIKLKDTGAEKINSFYKAIGCNTDSKHFEDALFGEGECLKRAVSLTKGDYRLVSNFHITAEEMKLIRTLPKEIDDVCKELEDAGKMPEAVERFRELKQECSDVLDNGFGYYGAAYEPSKRIFFESLAELAVKTGKTDGALGLIAKKAQAVTKAADPVFRQQIAVYRDMMKETGDGYLFHTNNQKYTDMMNTLDIIEKYGKKNELSEIESKHLSDSVIRLAEQCRDYLQDKLGKNQNSDTGKDRFAGAMGILKLLDLEGAEQLRATAQERRGKRVSWEDLETRAEKKAVQREKNKQAAPANAKDNKQVKKN